MVISGVICLPASENTFTVSLGLLESAPHSASGYLMLLFV